MNRFTSNKQEPYFTHIQNGTKTVEGRLNKGKWVDMSIGDVILVDNLSHSENTILVEIIGKNTYLSFKDMIEAEGMLQVIPDAISMEDALKAYYTFYTKNDEEKYGEAAFKIKVINE